MRAISDPDEVDRCERADEVRREVAGEGGAGLDDTGVESRVGVDVKEVRSSLVFLSIIVSLCGCWSCAGWLSRISSFTTLFFRLNLAEVGGLLANSWAPGLGGGKNEEDGEGKGEDDGGLSITRDKRGGSTQSKFSPMVMIAFGHLPNLGCL